MHASKKFGMVYPPAPWTLRGYAIQSTHLLDIDRVRPLIPSELEIISTLPGKTVGGVYVSSYAPASTLEYNELIIAAGLVRYAGKIGSWISHIYVDNADSVAGGQEIWGLPKELAEFNWKVSDRTGSGYDRRVSVRQGEQTLLRLSYQYPSFGLPLPIPFMGEVFSLRSGAILLFKSEFNSRVSIVNSELDVPFDSPFARFNFAPSALTTYLDDMRLTVGVPQAVGQTATAYSY